MSGIAEQALEALTLIRRQKPSAGLAARDTYTKAEGEPAPARLRQLLQGRDCDGATARPVCHAHWRRVMTVALMTLVNNVELSPTPGISVRACRAVLRCMARLASDDGEFRYGMRQSKVAALAEYSAATIKRAQRFLVEHGFLERVATGGGRRSTHWRIRVDRLGLTPPPEPPRTSSQPAKSQQPSPDEPAQGYTQISTRSYSPDAPAAATTADAVVTDMCEHGHR